MKDKIPKIFISQPMGDRSDEDIEEERNLILEDASRILGCDVREVPTFFKEYSHAKNDALRCLGRSLQMMADADHAYFATGWENRRGCKIEHEAAVQYGIHILKD